MKSTCPHCSSKNEIPDQYRDQKIKCPSCGQPFTATEDRDIIINQNPDLAKRADGTLASEPRDFSVWYIMGLLCLFGIPFFYGGSTLGMTYGVALCFFSIAVGNILYELRVIAHYLRERKP